MLVRHAAYMQDFATQQGGLIVTGLAACGIVALVMQRRECDGRATVTSGRALVLIWAFYLVKQSVP